MPSYRYMYANELIDTLKKKHAAGTYKSLVFYVEACEAGSIFEGLLPEGLNIYATTASNIVESSWGTYCPGEDPNVPAEYDTCLGDLYSVSWIEDSERYNLLTETLKQQYDPVKGRTTSGVFYSSHVMEYGDKELRQDLLYLYMGTNPTNANNTFVDDNSLTPPPTSSSNDVNQRDADLIHFWNKFRKAPEGSSRKIQAQKQFMEAMSHRVHLEENIKMIDKLLFGVDKGVDLLHIVRPTGQPLVDDWNCLKTLVRTFEKNCGSLSQYGMKHMRSIANIYAMQESQLSKWLKLQHKLARAFPPAHGALCIKDLAPYFIPPPADLISFSMLALYF